MIDLAPSNFDILKKTYNEIIQEVKTKDQTGQSSDYHSERRTLVFCDGSFLSVTEYIKNNELDYFHYDWFSKSKKVLLKFHSEAHTDKKYQRDGGADDFWDRLSGYSKASSVLQWAHISK